MHSRANSPFSAGDGMAHGFYETDINGMHVIAHGGDTVAFHSDLHLFLDKSVGIFVSFNSPGKQGAAAAAARFVLRRSRGPLFPGTGERRQGRSEGRQGGCAKSSPASIRRRAARGPTSSPLVDLIGQTEGRGRQRRQSAARGLPKGLVDSRVNGCTSARCVARRERTRAADRECGRRQGDPLQLWRTGPDHRFRPDAGLPLVRLDPAAPSPSLAILADTGPVADSAAGSAQI